MKSEIIVKRIYLRWLPMILLAIMVLQNAVLGQSSATPEKKQMGRFYKIPLTGEESIEEYAEKLKELFPDKKDLIEKVEKSAHQSVPEILGYVKNLYERELAEPGINTVEGKILLEEITEKCYLQVIGKSEGSLLNLLGKKDPIGICYQEYQNSSWYEKAGAKLMSEEALKKRIRLKIATELEKNLNELKKDGREPFHQHFFEENAEESICGYKAGKPYGYDMWHHNCHHFAKELRRVYAMLINATLGEQVWQAKLDYWKRQDDCEKYYDDIRSLSDAKRDEAKAVYHDKCADNYLQYSKEISAIDCSACPGDFQSAFSEWKIKFEKVNTWKAEKEKRKARISRVEAQYHNGYNELYKKEIDRLEKALKEYEQAFYKDRKMTDWWCRWQAMWNDASTSEWGFS